MLKKTAATPEVAPGPIVLATPPRTKLPAGTPTAPVVMGMLSFYLLSTKAVTDNPAVVVLASPDSASKSGGFTMCLMTTQCMLILVHPDAN